MSHLTTVHKLTARTKDDPIAARREIERGLLCADVHPASLPAESLLCVRRIRLHRIGRLSQDLKSILESLASRAVRPITESNVGQAEAVLFSSEAEMMACLALDWLDGAVQDHWWWRRVLGSLPLPTSPVRRWLRSPEWIPAAIFHLADKKRAASFAQALLPDERRVLIQAMFRAYQIRLPELHSPYPVQTSPESGVPPVALESGPPWVAILGHDPAGPDAHPDAQVLVAAALLLQRFPAVLRQVEFQRALQHWWSATNLPVTAISEPGASPELPSRRAEAPPEGAPKIAAEEPLAPPDAAVYRALPIQTEPDLLDHALSSQTEPGLLYHTDLGGLMYLVNFALFTGMYQDFTSPVELDDRPPIWDAINRLARELLESNIPASDAIWTMLAELAGSEPALPAPDLPLPNSWRLLPELGLDPIRSWQDLAALARTRIALALDTLETETADFLLRRAARIRVTLTHVTVQFPLDELSFPIRASGLDRDPGWVPSAGRSIRFVYE
jgi:hypothetical protein